MNQPCHLAYYSIFLSRDIIEIEKGSLALTRLPTQSRLRRWQYYDY